MQRVITAVRSTLNDLKLAIDGTIIMSENLRDALDSMYDARIPELWQKVSNEMEPSKVIIRKSKFCITGIPYQLRCDVEIVV